MIASFLDREPAGGWLSLAEAEALLATHGIPVAASHHCRDLERAIAVAAEIGAPVALKADFAAPAHASDIDAVMLGLEGESALRSGWRELERRVHAAGREWIGAIVQRLVPPGGADVLVGAISDPDLGPVLAVGFGGRRAGLGRNGCVPPAAGHRRRSRRADRLRRGRRHPAGRVPRQRRARSTGAARADAALRAPAPGAPRGGRSGPQPRPMHDKRLHRARHATTNRAPAPNRARQDLVTARSPHKRQQARRVARHCAVQPPEEQAAACQRFLESVRWREGLVCRFCGTVEGG